MSDAIRDFWFFGYGFLTCGLIWFLLLLGQYKPVFFTPLVSIMRTKADNIRPMQFERTEQLSIQFEE